MRIHVEEPLIVSAGGIPYNKPHLDALASKVDEQADEIERLTAVNEALRQMIKTLTEARHDLAAEIERLTSGSMRSET